MRFYLLLNAVLYAVFALWCTVRPASTAQSLGYVDLNASGRSEYLVIYGGLQFGLAAFFALMARDADNLLLLRTGLYFAASLYVPIVVFRLFTVVKFWPVSPLTLGVASLEVALAVWGLALIAQARPVLGNQASL